MMKFDIYSDLLEELKASASIFLVNEEELIEEIDEDISSIIDTVDIVNMKRNIDGNVMTVPELLVCLSEANREGDRQKCIGYIAMIRSAFADIENAFSNSLDSMEALVVSIRDK